MDIGDERNMNPLLDLFDRVGRFVVVDRNAHDLAAGFFETNARSMYSVNNLTATRSADGTASVQFGGCTDAVPNCLPITPGWSYLVRMYRPRKAILDKTWSFPEAKPAS